MKGPWLNPFPLILILNRDGIFKLLRSPGIDSAILCSLAGRYGNPVPTRFLAPIECFWILAPGKFRNKNTIFRFVPNAVLCDYLVWLFLLILLDQRYYHNMIIRINFELYTYKFWVWIPKLRIRTGSEFDSGFENDPNPDPETPQK
jgi:hypothetical protein